VEYLRQNGAQIMPAPSDPENAVRNEDAEVVLVIPAITAVILPVRTLRMLIW